MGTIKEHLFSHSTWLRGFFIVLYAILFYQVALVVILAVAVLQFGFMVFTGKLNEYLLSLSETLSIYSYQIISYITYHSDRKPFPFSAWPKNSERPEE